MDKSVSSVGNATQRRSTSSLASWFDVALVLDVYAHYAYPDDMSPEFDPKKDAANLAKHGVSLTTGDGVLHDPLAITIEDSSALDEQRWITVGANTLGSLMVVVWTERGEEIRLISVRPATPKERKSYEKGI